MIAAGPAGDGVWHVEFRNPAKRNALGVASYAALADTLLAASAAADLRVVLMSGQGPMFCAGNDIAEFATEWPQPAGGPVVRFLQALANVPVPVIAAVQGGAIGIGATMLLHCDVVVVAPDAFLQYPFTDRGIAPEGASSLLLPRLVGTLRATELLLTGRRVDAEEALTLGLVSQVSAARQQFEQALQTAHQLAAKPKDAVVATKRLLRQEMAETISARFEQEIGTINHLLSAGRP